MLPVERTESKNGGLYCQQDLRKEDRIDIAFALVVAKPNEAGWPSVAVRFEKSKHEIS
jgi:hypothetical protein